MRLDRLRKFNRLVIGGHASVLSDSDLNELRSLLSAGSQPVVLHRLPTSAEMRRMAPFESILISSDNLSASKGHMRARRASKGGARYVYRKIDNTHAVMVRLE